MKQLERTPVRSTRAPNMIGSRKPPRPPTRPTIPDTAPMSLENSLEMYLKTEALPKAQDTPTTDIRAVNTQGLRAMSKVRGAATVGTVNWVCGEERMNR